MAHSSPEWHTQPPDGHKAAFPSEVWLPVSRGNFHTPHHALGHLMGRWHWNSLAHGRGPEWFATTHPSLLTHCPTEDMRRHTQTPTTEIWGQHSVRKNPAQVGSSHTSGWRCGRNLQSSLLTTAPPVCEQQAFLERGFCCCCCCFAFCFLMKRFHFIFAVGVNTTMLYHRVIILRFSSPDSGWEAACFGSKAAGVRVWIPRSSSGTREERAFRTQEGFLHRGQVVWHLTRLWSLNSHCTCVTRLASNLHRRALINTPASIAKPKLYHAQRHPSVANTLSYLRQTMCF